MSMSWSTSLSLQKVADSSQYSQQVPSIFLQSLNLLSKPANF
jgi:hypothetical protein